MSEIQKKYFHELAEINFNDIPDAKIAIVTAGNKTQLVPVSDLLKVILGGSRVVGGSAASDIATNNAVQTQTSKTLLTPVLVDPVIRVTPPGGGNEETVTDGTLYSLMVDLKNTMDDSSLTGWNKVIEAGTNVEKVSYCAMIDTNDVNGTITIPVEDIFYAAGISGTGRSIDARSLVLSVWTASGDTYTQKYDCTAIVTAPDGILELIQIDTEAAEVGQQYSVCIHFRIA